MLPAGQGMRAGSSDLQPSCVVAVVILYNPDLVPLICRLQAVLEQVDHVIAVDNSREPRAEPAVTALSSCTVYLPLRTNLGIAVAQNRGIQAARDLGATHVLLLDQDSAIPAGMVTRLLAAESLLAQRNVQFAAVGPVFVDEKTEEMSRAPREAWLSTRAVRLDPVLPDPVEADYIIASGSLVRMEIFDQIGGMAEELFIDWVDIEWCLRARHRGFKCYVVPDVVMRHSVGIRAVRILGRNIYIHNGIRAYYRMRNAVFLLRVRHMGLAWRIHTLLRIPKYLLIFALLTPPRIDSFRLLCHACLDGFRGRMGAFER